LEDPLETFLIIVFPTYWTEDKKIIGYFVSYSNSAVDSAKK